LFFTEKHEVLQKIPGIHARPGEEASRRRIQEAQENLEEVQKKLSIPEAP